MDESIIAVRDASPQDAAALAYLMGQLGYPTSIANMEERLRAIMSSPDYATLVAEMDGRTVGVIGLFAGYSHEIDGLYGHILVLSVDEKYRNLGVGQALMEAAERWFSVRNVGNVIVTSNKRRVEAHKFYEQLGYEATGLRFVKRLAFPAPPGDPDRPTSGPQDPGQEST